MKPMRGPCTSILVLMSLFCFFSSAGARVYIDIDSPAFLKFPIALAGFRALDGEKDPAHFSAKLTKMLAKYLEITGFFSVIPDQGLPLESGRIPGKRGDIPFAQWSASGAEYLVAGGFSATAQGRSIECRLYDIDSGESIMGKRYSGGMEDEKRLISQCAGDILASLTGGEDVFDTKIAFSMKRGKTSEIYTINFDGSEMTRLTNFQSITLFPRWSPGGRYMAIVSYRSGNPDLYLLDTIGKGSRKILRYSGLNLPGAWSPDGEKMLISLAKDGNEEIYALEISSGRLQRLTTHSAIDVSPVWSPDGRRIAFVSDRAGTPQIYLMDSEGSRPRRLTFEGNYNTSPSWSPVGDRIAFESRVEGRYQIFSIREDGSGLIRHSVSVGDCESPAWSPDGRYLAFIEKSKDRYRLCVVNANGSNLRVLHEAAESLTGAAWSPHLGR
ncbi:MAG: Tol-Pal system beta propeller repeat protein TolB [Deltaproteobacteria bacterium]|nr:Tol-Pal system beta propeller repeat protein TolB [Deltaproteobacteria bacterium]